TGSLAFFHANPAWCYSEEEVAQLLKDCGFELVTEQRRTISYLRSPHSCHGRTEEIYSFKAVKVKTCESSACYERLPVWLRQFDQPIPDMPGLIIDSSNHLLRAQVLAAVDGSQSIRQIGHLLSQRYDLTSDEATHAVVRILSEEYESRT
ncbi:MAG: hypothetical protein OES38_03760, partial [Gammaproteobacteria bacterium]|nr:hypothetical protein [Gammaproteobacteria bacterium]